MDIQFTLDENEWTDEISNTLITHLRPDDFNLAMQSIARASFLEYIQMIHGKGIPSKADDLRQSRLVFLIKYYFKNRIPTEREVSSFFHINTGAAKTLLRNTFSTYASELGGCLNESLKGLLYKATHDNDGERYFAVINSVVQVEKLNSLLADHGPKLAPIKKKKLSSSEYEIETDTYDCLMEALNE